MKRIRKKRCENCNSFRHLDEELTAYYWNGARHFCACCQLLIDKDDCCENWQKRQPDYYSYLDDIDKILNDVDSFIEKQDNK